MVFSVKTINDRTKVGIEAFVATWAIIRISELSTTNVLTIFAYAFLFYIFGRIRERKSLADESKLQIKVEYMLSALFTFFYLCGDFEHIYAGLDNILFRFVVLVVTAVGLFILLEKAISIIVISTEEWQASEKAIVGKWIPFVSGLVCFVCWIPYLLANYPGIMTIDSMNQFAQVVGVYAASNHHPWAHTQVMKLFYQIGMFFTGNTTFAISFYTIFQMLFMAACISYLIATLMKCHLNKWALGLIIAFYALVPYNALYAVTIWKDSMFAGGVLLYITTLLRILICLPKKENTKEGIADMGMLVLSGIMMCLFRTNGWYAFLVTIPFCIYTFRRYWQSMLLLQGIILIAVLLVKGPVMNANDVIQPDLVESLSIPVQQISRVIVSGKSLTEKQSTFLNRILDTSKIEELYNPYVSDGFKRLVRAGDEEYLEAHFGEFLKIYLQIGLQHPGDYLLAFRDQSVGYWFPVQEGIIAGDTGVIENEFGVMNKPVLKGRLVIKINEIALKLKDMLPGYGILWSMGGILWIILMTAALMIIRGDRSYLLLYVPCIAIFLTLVIATPVAKEFRYAYPYIFCVPLYLLLPFLPKKK